MKKEQCQVEGCSNLAKWSLNKTLSDGTKRWLHVCDRHEEEIAQENLKRGK